jgi:hypothetical protein
MRTNIVDCNSETANMYGVEDCPKCKSEFRWPTQQDTIRCDDCGFVEDVHKINGEG